MVPATNKPPRCTCRHFSYHVALHFYRFEFFKFCGFFHNPPKKCSCEKKFPQKFSYKLYIQISPVESSCCHLFKTTLSFRNKTFQNKKFTGEDCLKVLRCEEHLQFPTRTLHNCDRVKLITGLLCFTSLHVVSPVNCMQLVLQNTKINDSLTSTPTKI